MSQQTFDSHLLNLLADARKRLPAKTSANERADGAWDMGDGVTLHFEQSGEELLMILRMPEKHLDPHQLTQLLMLCDQGWPIPLAASLDADDAQALLFTRLWIATLDTDALSQAILALQHARGRWLQAPPAIHAASRTHAGAIR